jgi:hypothetical protein
LLATGAARNRVSSGRAVEPFPGVRAGGYGEQRRPVGLPGEPGDGCGPGLRARAAAQDHGIVPELAEGVGYFLQVAGPVGEDEAVPALGEGCRDVGDDLAGALVAGDQVLVDDGHPAGRGRAGVPGVAVGGRVEMEHWRGPPAGCAAGQHAGRATWFPISRSNKEYVLSSAERAAPRRVCVEFRNHTWMTDDNQRETLDFLSAHRLPYVRVDEPQGYSNSIPPVLAATSDLAVVRLHGHSDQWESHAIQERFRYRYDGDELAAGRQRQAAGGRRRRDPRGVQQLLPRLRARQRGAAGSAGPLASNGGGRLRQPHCLTRSFGTASVPEAVPR